MKSSLVKSIVAAVLLTPVVALAVPNPAWDLTNAFNVNSLDPANGPVDGNTPSDVDYKFDVDPPDEDGPLQGLLDTLISDDGLTALVSWAGSLSFEEIYLKSSNKYIWWDVSAVDWSLYDSFYVSNTKIFNSPKSKSAVPSAQEISHISLTGDVTTRVPDGGMTAILLGAGLFALALAKRRSRA